MRGVRLLASVLVAGAACVACAGSQAPSEPRSADRECSEDSDCVFRPRDPCECEPCGTAWRRAVNQEAAQELLMEHARADCGEPECPDCTTTWRGTEPVCVAGQCSVRHTN